MWKKLIFYFLCFFLCFSHLFQTVLMSANVIMRGKYVVLIHNERIIPSKSAFRAAHSSSICICMTYLTKKKREGKQRKEAFVRLTVTWRFPLSTYVLRCIVAVYSLMHMLTMYGLGCLPHICICAWHDYDTYNVWKSTFQEALVHPLRNVYTPLYSENQRLLGATRIRNKRIDEGKS